MTLLADADRHNTPKFVAERTSSFCQLVMISGRAVNAAWFATVFLFLIFAPQQTGFCCEILALRSSGHQLPPWLIVSVLIGHASILWLPIMFFSLPWVFGNAAVRLRDHLIPPDRPGSYVGQVNRLYGRLLALCILTGLALALLFGLLYALPMGILIREELLTAQPGHWIWAMPLRPTMIASAIGFLLVAALIVVVCALTIAVMAIEDIGLIRAFRRSLSFIGSHKADTAVFWMFVTLLGLPILAMQHAPFFVHIVPASIVVAIAAALLAAYAVTVAVAFAEALYLVRRPTA